MDFKGKNLVIFGDSIMNGSGNGNFGVGEYLVRDMGFVLHKYCVGGARVGYYPDKNWIVNQIIKAIGDGIPADYIVFNGFTNDCNMTDGKHCDVPLGKLDEGSGYYDVFSESKEGSTFSHCFESVTCAMQKYFPKAKILFVRPHNMGRRDDSAQRAYGERAVEICKKRGIAVCDLYAHSGMNTFIGKDRDLYTADTYGRGRGDCTHPNARGYEEKYMPLIEEAIRSLK